MDLEDVRRSWTRLGREDPLWAVYVAPGRRGGGWDTEEFLATGEAEVAGSMSALDRLGLSVGCDTALDFGCGVGRLSNPLARRFHRVIAVDASEPMLGTARTLDRSEGRIDWVLNTRADLSFQPTGSVDLSYSSLVLQHLPREDALRYVTELVRVLRPGGVAILQVASRPTLSLKGLAFRVLPPPLIGWAQTRLLGYPSPMLMTALTAREVEASVSGLGASVVDVSVDDTYGGHWVYERVVIRAAT